MFVKEGEVHLNAILAIALGGACGALARHGVNLGAARFWGLDFPYGTLTVNIAGSFLIGALVSLMAHLWQPSEAVKLFAVTGFLGAFTTFSTFSLDVVTLWERQDYWGAGLYLGGSVVLSIAALLAGMALVRAVLV